MKRGIFYIPLIIFFWGCSKTSMTDSISISETQRQREVCVCDIMKLTKLSQSRISYHIKILKEAGLISDRQEGRWVYYSLKKEALFLIKEWITSLTDYSSNKKRCCE